MNELEQMIDALPKHESTFECHSKAPNAYVHVDEDGFINIFPIDGGMLWAQTVDFNVDIAPFAG